MYAGIGIEPQEEAMKRRVLIPGITGQDGSYLVELLLSKGYEVLGMVRRTAEDPEQWFARLRDILDRIHFTWRRWRAARASTA